ncbi:PDZ domain-containing protein [Marinihelvus fidelis]|nr:PDZ domain-containing protein [Marinihelvus fidelis]
MSATCRFVCVALVSSFISLPIGADTAPEAQDQNQHQDPADQLRHNLQALITSARDRVFPSLVNIRVITANYFNGDEHKGLSVGSGTVISPEGYVLTNFHVVRNGQKFTCTLNNKVEISAELVGEDPLTDLAVLKLDMQELEELGISLSHAKLGDSDNMVIGDTVMSMGSPWALSRSVSLGIISNTDRLLASVDDDAEEMHFNRDQRTGIFTRWIQHDSSISPGNSGGPLVNLEGEVIGVNAMGRRRGGDMGFAIPSNLARDVAADLVEHGQVLRSWYGWKLKPIKNSGFSKGVLVNSVVEDSPAAEAGIEAGDIILGINDEPVTVWFPEEEPLLLMQLAGYPVGSEVKLEWQRDGETHNATLVTTQLEADRGKEASFRKWGVVAIEITASMARNRRLPDTRGVLVQGVRSGSPAQTAEPPLNYEDVILAVNGEAVNSIAKLLEIYEALDSDETAESEVLIEYTRRGTNQLTLIKPKESTSDDRPRELAKAWIGIAVQPVLPNLARHLGTPEATGFRVTRVYPDTLAADSGLAAGDVILALDDQPLKPINMQDFGMFHRQVRRLDIGATARLTVQRGDEKLDVPVELERTRLTPGEASNEYNDDFGLGVRELTFLDRDENRWPVDMEGLLITKVERAGWAQLGHLRPTDLVLSINDEPMHSVAQFRETMDALDRQRPERVTFLVLRGAETRFQYVQPDWTPQIANTTKD